MNDHCFGIDDAATIDLIIPELASWFGVTRETIGNEAFEILDSFDWRLFNKGWLLLDAQGRYSLIDIHTGQKVSALTAEEKKPLRFHWDFPETDLSKYLKDVLEMRALLPFGVVTRQWIHCDLLNNDEKTVARLALETYTVNGGVQAVHQCRVIPVRGYPKPVKRIADRLKQLGLKPAEQSPFLTLLERKGHSPGGYSSKIKVSLQPEMRAAEAIRCILKNLTSVMHLNIPGVREDIDSEFLHDFRVSVRRARSLLSQMKGVLDAETTARLQQRLKGIGAVTGNVRDLDVYLLKESAYIDRVPPVLQPGIIQLFRMLQRKRRQAKDRMVKTMSRDSFSTALADLDTFVQAGSRTGTEGPEGDRPIGELAKAAIYKRYRRIIKQGSRISEDTPDEELHEIRIDCKKLRYLLEFFSSLFPEEAMAALIKQLKQLQDNLGDFNDLSVQQDFLISHLQSAGPQTQQVVMLSAATGGLITQLSMAHRQVRSQFLNVFAAFKSPDNHKRFVTLFT
ncbi:CHAD domain-containing protein [uncultured Desulfosarcina sp.]|uniref:CHAD domain-containing protein n=1 Tax=uncultured Desulfosarcina sp. TaxID=218289 RepID=UPI0029C7789E|nr:CHAD domain-containing protein [uncultured Desulfosarcina sp.]